MDKLIKANFTQSMGESKTALFEKIKADGGWNQKYQYLSFYHSGCSDRECYYGNEYLRTGWYTTFTNRDEYFLWALSPQFLRNFKQKVIKDFHTSVSPAHYDFNNFDFSYMK